MYIHLNENIRKMENVSSYKMEKTTKLKEPINSQNSQKSQIKQNTLLEGHGTQWYLGNCESQPLYSCISNAQFSNHNFLVALDYTEEGWNNITKIYGSYKNSRVFYKLTKDVPSEERCFYVIVPENTECCLFADLEWNLEWKTEEQIVDKFTTLVIENLHIAGIKIDQSNLLWATASQAETSKGSLHCHCPYVHFKNIKEQLRFFNGIKLKIDSDGDDWSFIDATDKSYILKTFIDFGVYNKNRQFRLPYSSKMKKDTKLGQRPLIPYDEVNFEFSDWTITDIQNPLYLVNTMVYPEEIVCNKRVTWSKALVQGIIDSQKLDVTVDTFKGAGLITLKNKTGCRVCPIGGETNKSDNAYITIKNNKLHYCCHDAGCKGKTKIIYNFSYNEELRHREPPFKWYYWEFMNNKRKYVMKNDKGVDIPTGECLKLRERMIDEVNQYCCVITGSNKEYILYRIKQSLTNPHNPNYIGKNQEVVLFKDKLFPNFKKIYEQFSVSVGATEMLGTGVWTNSSRRHQKIDEVCMPYSSIQHQPQDSFNTFAGFAIDKENAMSGGNKDPTPMLNFIFNAWCQKDQKIYDWVLNWMSHLVQKPWIKMETSIVLKGSQGCGKGMIIQILGKIIGQAHFFQPTSQDDMFGQFNYLLDNKFLVFADEMFWGGDKKKAGQLKKLLTESTRTSNIKFGAMRRLQNNINWVFASNEDWVIPAGIKARRFTVLDVSNDLYEMTKEQKKELYSFCPFSFAKFLYNRDLGNFNPHEHINTSGLTEQKILSMSPAHKWFVEYVENETCFDKWIEKKDFYTLFLNTFSGAYKPSMKAFWMDLNKFSEWKCRRKTQTRRIHIFLPERMQCIEYINKLYDCEIIQNTDLMSAEEEQEAENQGKRGDQGGQGNSFFDDMFV